MKEKTFKTMFHQSRIQYYDNCNLTFQVQNIMQLAGATVDLLDVQGSSVMICLEDGWDCTTQVI